jgi:hypothetical protein
VDEFLPHLHVLKYEGWRSFTWEELACSRSTPSDDGASKCSPQFATLRNLEFDLAGDLGTPITSHFNVYEDDDDVVDLLQFS